MFATAKQYGHTREKITHANFGLHTSRFHTILYSMPGVGYERKPFQVFVIFERKDNFIKQDQSSNGTRGRSSSIVVLL